ncbi:MAG: uridine kinase [Actinomycetota bacterium]|nr:uridine kinase [Actinomycetota bacterium]
MRARPVTWPVLVDLLVDRVLATPAEAAVRVAVDGADAARPGDLADALVEPLRARGRPVVRVPAAGFLRAASLRLERGRTDPEAYYEVWLDDGALAREVLDPAGPGGSGRVLPSLRDPGIDRATRAAYVDLPPAAVVVVDGPLLLGRWLPFDLTVHLAMSARALARRTPEQMRWTLPAFERYDEEVRPLESADVVVRVEDPRHPALVVG